MKIQTSLKSGMEPLSSCVDVEMIPHSRNGVPGNKVYAYCPVTERSGRKHYIYAQGWFPSSRTVYWDNVHAKLTGR